MVTRGAGALLQLGLIAVALAALPYRLFELDRFFVPKELVLHVTALVVGILLFLRARTRETSAVDGLLVLFLGWSVASTIFATNHWLAQRALGVSVSSVVLFWGARQIGAAGSYRPIIVGAAIATVVAAVTGLVQAYGFDSEFFSQNRAPGGTFGNRNFVAHFVTIGLPALMYSAVTARTSAGAMAGSLSVALVAALLVMTRTRAAWLAVAASSAVLLFALMVSRRYWQESAIGGRLVRLTLTAAVGVAAAVWLPNRLNWRSDSPYLDSALAVVDYESGSGRGRVMQYRNSLLVARADPLLGAGPGNWPVRYVRFAPPNDRSLNQDGMTDNPWPSSDWVAHVAERGVVGAGALLAAFVLLFFGAFRGWPMLPDRDTVLAKVALAGTITATMVVSVFDAVLLLAAPALLAWTIIGAASGAGRPQTQTSSAKGWCAIVIACLLIVGVSTARSAAQVASISSVGTGASRAGWSTAAVWDPGSYRIALRVAELQADRGQCATARVHARRAQELFPNAAAPRRILQRC
jgi:hypothetical protein